METFLDFIEGRWQPGSDPAWEENRNPARPQDILGRATRSSREDVSAAIAAAEKAAREWSRVPRPQRGALLARVAGLMKERAEDFARAMTLEEGKSLNESRGEVSKSINVLEFTAGEARRPVGEVIPSELANTMIYTTRAPLGVVGIITPWNFPLCIPVWKIAPALIEGNTILFKPASLTPWSATLLVKAFEDAGAPAGVLNLVHGGGSAVGNAIVDDSRVKAISFTGSNEVGSRLHARAAQRMARTQLEMGGKNAVIVCEDADLDAAAAAVAAGAFGSTGQRCTATSRVIVHREVHEEFRAKLLAETRKIRVGDGLANPLGMGPVVDRKQFDSVMAAMGEARKAGARLICGGEPVAADPERDGYFVAPTIFDDVRYEMRIARDEIFGPVLAILPVDGFDQAIRVANGVEYGLSSSVYTRDVMRVMRYVDQVETGMLHVNSPTVGGEAQAPFGGMKATGFGGREMGRHGPEFFCEIKTVYIDTNASTRKGNLY